MEFGSCVVAFQVGLMKSDGGVLATGGEKESGERQASILVD